ncbi:MAG TPA: porin family protein [bacterium]
MKKFTLMVGCLLLFVLASSFAMAEEKGSEALVPKTLIGVEAGINLASLSGPSVNDVFASRLGFVGGAFLNFHLTPVLAIQPEVLYEQKGGKFGGTPYQLDYFEIPVLLNLTFLGPLGVLLGPAFNSTLATQGVQNATQSDVGLILGAQVNVSSFLVSGRYEVGLTDVSSTQKNISNGTFTFLAGLSFI